MKTLLNLSLVLALGALVVSPMVVRAEDDDHGGMEMKEVPEAVAEAARAAVPGGMVTEIEREGRGVYEAEVALPGGGECDVVVTADGLVLEIVQELGIDALPAPVRKAVDATMPMAALGELEKETLFVYEAEGKTADGGKSVWISPTGRVAKLWAEEEDEGEEEEESGEAKVAIDELADVVKAAVEKAAPGAWLRSAAGEKEDGAVIYEVQFTTADGVKKEAKVTADGDLVEVAQNISIENLPGKVRESLQAMFPNGVDELELKQYVFYSAEKSFNGQQHEFTFSPAGKNTKVESEQEGDEGEHEGHDDEDEN